MSLYDYLDDFPGLNENMVQTKNLNSGGIRTLNDIDPMEYLNGDDDIFWWLIKYESFSNKTSLKNLRTNVLNTSYCRNATWDFDESHDSINARD